MKKNRMMRVASALLVAVLLTTCCISGTFAKYTSQATGTAVAKVAKWDVTVGGTALNATTQNFTFNLFETIYDTDSSTETDVASGHIAPGTKGSFGIVINNNSEVNVGYDVDLVVPNELKDIITFTVSSETGTLNMTDDKTVTVTVNWEWPYERGDDADAKAAADAADLALGVNGADYNIVATITVTQVD